MDKKAAYQTAGFMLAGAVTLVALGLLYPGLRSGTIALLVGAALLVAAAALFIWNRKR